MWIRLRENVRKWEIAGRPNYYLKYDEAAQQHLEGYLITLDTRVRTEAEVRESLWDDAKGI